MSKSKHNRKQILARIGLVMVLASLGYVIGSWHIREVKAAQETSLYRAMDLNLKFMTLKALAAGKALD